MPDPYSTQVQRKISELPAHPQRPTDPVRLLEQHLCTLHSGVAAVTTRSAGASILGLFVELGLPGHHMVASSTLPRQLLTDIERLSRRLSIQLTLQQATNVSDWHTVITPQTRLLIGSDRMDSSDLLAVCKLAQTQGIASCVDVSNTTAYWCNPFACGAALVLYSDLSMLAGAGAHGSAWVESGLMRWDTETVAARYAQAPCVDSLDANNLTPISASVRAQTHEMLGGSMDSTQAALVITGLETLRLRLDHLQTNRDALAKTLEQIPPSTPGRQLTIDLQQLCSNPSSIPTAIATLCKRLRYTQVTHTEHADELELIAGLQATDDVVDEMNNALTAVRKAVETLPAQASSASTRPGLAPQTPRPLVICLHGAGHNRQVWRYTQHSLRQAGWASIALDFPGHDAASGHGMQSINEYADWLEGHIQANYQQPVVVMGHSMGSLVALRWAAEAGPRAAGLILVSTAFPMSVSDEILNHAHRPTEPLCRSISQWCLAPQHRPGFDAAAGPIAGVHLVNEGVRMMQRLPDGVMQGDFYACHTYDIGLNDARAVQCPVLLISGEQDAMTPIKNLQPLLDALQARANVATRSSWLPDCGHMPMVESANASTQAVIQFLDEL